MKFSSVYLVLSLSLLACGPDHPAGSVDSPPNGSFEDWASSDVLPAGWTPADGNGSYVRIAGYNSLTGLELRPESGAWVAVRSSTFAVSPGRQYDLQTEAFGAFNLTAGLRATVVWLDSSGAEAGRSEVATYYPPPPTWQSYSWLVTAPSNGANAYVVLRAVYVPTDVDDVVLVARPEPASQSTGAGLGVSGATPGRCCPRAARVGWSTGCRIVHAGQNHRESNQAATSRADFPARAFAAALASRADFIGARAHPRWPRPGHRAQTAGPGRLAADGFLVVTTTGAIRPPRSA